jgi:hypothetical protein
MTLETEPAKSQSENSKRVLRSRKKFYDAGLTLTPVWIHPDERKKMRDYAKSLPLTKSILGSMRSPTTPDTIYLQSVIDTLEMYKLEKASSTNLDVNKNKELIANIKNLINEL